VTIKRIDTVSDDKAAKGFSAYPADLLEVADNLRVMLAAICNHATAPSSNLRHANNNQMENPTQKSSAMPTNRTT